MLQSTNIKKIIAGTLKILSLTLLVFSLITLIFAVDDIITPGGFTDAAPYWVFFFMISIMLGIPGLLLLFVSKIISKKLLKSKFRNDE